MPDVPPEHARLVLRNDRLEVVVVPTKGADIYAVIDRPSGIDVLWKTPWGWRDPGSLPPLGDSQADWLARYPGGWQILVPHAGPDRRVAGRIRGFHGEAALLPWHVIDAGPEAAVLRVDLLTVPLRITRSLTLTGPVLALRETIENRSPDPVEVMWVHHPGFGAPFVDEHCRLDTGARTFVSDAVAPGTLLPPDTIGQLPDELRLAPPPDRPRAVFGALTDFTAPWFALTSHTHGFGIGMAWDPVVFPHAWCWQECHASPGFPWYRRAYVIAVEPANVLPGEGQIGRWTRSSAPTVPPGGQFSADLVLTRFPAGGPVTGVDRDGTVHSA